MSDEQKNEEVEGQLKHGDKADSPKQVEGQGFKHADKADSPKQVEGQGWSHGDKSDASKEGLSHGLTEDADPTEDAPKSEDLRGV
jgi:hypothetical protein